MEERNRLEQWWDNTKAWFKRSETIFLARLYAVIGFVTATVGAMDWAPLWNTLKTGTSFTKAQLVSIGLGVAGAAVSVEIARRLRTKEVDGHLVPTAEALPKDVEPIKKKTKKA